MWLWIILLAVALLAVAAFKRRPKRQSAVSRLRAHFPRIAHQRLVGNFHELDPILDQATLRMLFDWMMAQAYCRTGSDGFGELMHWQSEHGEAQMNAMLEEVIRDSVDILPQPALRVIDVYGGREFAAILIGHSLTEAAAKIAAPAERDPA